MQEIKIEQVEAIDNDVQETHVATFTAGEHKAAVAALNFFAEKRNEMQRISVTENPINMKKLKKGDMWDGVFHGMSELRKSKKGNGEYRSARVTVAYENGEKCKKPQLYGFAGAQVSGVFVDLQEKYGVNIPVSIEFIEIRTSSQGDYAHFDISVLV